MSFKPPVENYTRTAFPGQPSSLPSYVTEELKKLEKVLATVTEALAAVDKRLTAGHL